MCQCTIIFPRKSILYLFLTKNAAFNTRFGIRMKNEPRQRHSEQFSKSFLSLMLSFDISANFDGNQKILMQGNNTIKK